jgi:hypothetical protein
MAIEATYVSAYYNCLRDVICVQSFICFNWDLKGIGLVLLVGLAMRFSPSSIPFKENSLSASCFQSSWMVYYEVMLLRLQHKIHVFIGHNPTEIHYSSHRSKWVLKTQNGHRPWRCNNVHTSVPQAPFWRKTLWANFVQSSLCFVVPWAQKDCGQASFSSP